VRCKLNRDSFEGEFAELPEVATELSLCPEGCSTVTAALKSGGAAKIELTVLSKTDFVPSLRGRPRRRRWKRSGASGWNHTMMVAKPKGLFIHPSREGLY
jgi:hypothetical protein